MEVQQSLAFEWCQRQIGGAMEVMIDKVVDAERNVWLADLCRCADVSMHWFT